MASRVRVRVMVINATFNNISVESWWLASRRFILERFHYTYNTIKLNVLDDRSQRTADLFIPNT